MDEVERNYQCFVCKTGEMMTHEEWKEHGYSDRMHLATVKHLIEKRLFCEKCDVQFEDQTRFNRHCRSNKHINGRLTQKDLYCAKCETQCTNKEKWDKHILTAKHLKEKEEELTEEQLYCSKCRTQTHNKGEWEKHCKTNKHNAEIFTEKTCEVCNVVILNKPGWVQHCKTKKHVNNNGQTVSAAVQHTTA